jgi:CrcB protein
MISSVRCKSPRVKSFNRFLYNDPAMNPFYFLLGLGLAGGLGTLARYGVGVAAAAVFGTSYPYGTFFVNVFGCFLFGLAAGLFAVPASEWRIICLTGFLGGFTTFSAFAFENYQFLEQHRYAAFAVHLAGQNILGIAAVLAGFVIASYFPVR